jgi:D-alanine transaminase
MSQTVFLNGEYLPLDEAKIPVTDRGFVFGDGVYEVIPAFQRKPFRLTEHLQRLSNSLKALYIKMPYKQQQWQQYIHSLIEKTDPKIKNISIYLQISRGSEQQRDHQYNKEIQPTVFIRCDAIQPLNEKVLTSGINAVTHEDIRWKFCHIKSTSLLASVLLKQYAKQQDAEETLLIRDGLLTEGSASNVFVVLNNQLITPPRSKFLLPGITRDVILNIAKDPDLGIDVKEDNIRENQLKDASEIWCSSSTREIMPVTRLNNQSVGDGKLGVVWKKIYQKYQDFKNNLH